MFILHLVTVSTPTTKITYSSLGSAVLYQSLYVSSWAYVAQYQEFSPLVLNVLIATINAKSDKVEGPGQKEEQVFTREHADSSLVISMSWYKFLPCSNFLQVIVRSAKFS